MDWQVHFAKPTVQTYVPSKCKGLFGLNAHLPHEGELFGPCLDNYHGSKSTVFFPGEKNLTLPQVDLRLGKVPFIPLKPPVSSLHLEKSFEILGPTS